MRSQGLVLLYYLEGFGTGGLDKLEVFKSLHADVGEAGRAVAFSETHRETPLFLGGRCRQVVIPRRATQFGHGYACSSVQANG